MEIKKNFYYLTTILLTMRRLYALGAELFFGDFMNEFHGNFARSMMQRDFGKLFKEKIAFISSCRGNFYAGVTESL